MKTLSGNSTASGAVAVENNYADKDYSNKNAQVSENVNLNVNGNNSTTFQIDKSDPAKFISLQFFMKNVVCLNPTLKRPLTWNSRQC